MNTKLVRPARRGRPANLETRTEFAELEEAAPQGRAESLYAPPPAAPERPELRPVFREKDPRERAARRSAELRGHLGDLDEGTDDFYIDPKTIPDGWSYEWKRKTVFGLEDPAYTVAVARRGWDAVPAGRHPEMMPHGASSATIERKGMVLMERPKDITDEVRQNDRIAARQAIQKKEEQLSQSPSGQFDRDHPNARPQLKKSYAPLDVPRDR